MLRILMLCVAAAMICVALKKDRPEMAAVTAMAAGVTALMMSMDDLKSAANAFQSLSAQAAISPANVQMMLRAVGIALASEFGAQLCKDAGEGALASRIEFGARAALLAMSLPVLSGLVTQLIALLP